MLFVVGLVYVRVLSIRSRLVLAISCCDPLFVSSTADAVVATSMSIINRLALLVFPLPTVLLLLQMTATIAILYPLLWARVLTFNPWSFSRFQQLLGISFFYTANTAFALFGLRGMNLPMYTAVKRLTPMVILVTKVSARLEFKPLWL